MKAWGVRGTFVVLLLAGWACSNGKSTDTLGSGAGAGSGSGQSGAGVAGGAAGATATGSAAKGGSGSGSSGKTGGSAGAAGKPPASGGDGCAVVSCEVGKHCELVAVQCIRAPCPAQAMCVSDTPSGGAGGASGTAGASGSTGAACGSRGLAPCPSGQYCELAAGSGCGASDAGGHCQPQSMICPEIYQPVCGCDGQTYGNACMAGAAGVSVDKSGACGAAGSADNDCDLRKVLCKRVQPECPDGQVPSVSGSCYGDCVAVESCTCTAPEQCPLPDKYTCHMSAAHCGPFV